MMSDTRRDSQLRPVLPVVPRSSPRGDPSTATPGASGGTSLRRRAIPAIPQPSLAHHAIAVCVAHIGVGGVRSRDRCNPVAARLLARDSAVSVVVVL